MNDAELDRLLDMWQPPGPPPSLRESLLARFPRAERHQFARPLRWVLAIAIASIALALAMAQTVADSPDFMVLNALTRIYHHLLFGLETMQAPRTVAQIRNADPKVYSDGQPAPPLQYSASASMLVQVPGDGAYAIVVYNLRLSGQDPSRGGWVEAGRAHDRVIEFQAGVHQVRIECNQQIFDTDRSVFVRRRR
jgi:hypothetical protein